MNVDIALDARATLAEGPIWDEHAGCLRWVDIPAGLVHRFDPATGTDTAFDAGEPVGAVAARRGGGLVLATASGIVTCAEDGTRRQMRHLVGMPPGGRFNDGKADLWGRFWAGTLVAGVRNAGALYRLDPDGTLHTMLTGVSVSNGLGWSPDGRTMYYADSPTGGVDAFDHDPATGEITNRRRVADVDRGRPDGLTVDAEGMLWVALWEGGAVRRYAPDGRLLRTVAVPARRVTSCAFSGSTLYITTASKGLSDAELADQPHAGGIFALDAGVPGQRTGEWFG
jgi:sugar lactone lactonase YvrE